jgi:K+ transporter
LLPSAQPSASTSRRAIQIGHRGLRTVPTAVTLGALGVVYGDIGTSPLYALKEAVKAANAGAAPTPESVAQRHGTGFIGGIFGPIMLVWFVVIGALGLRGIVMVPVILAAFNPFHAIALLTRRLTERARQAMRESEKEFIAHICEKPPARLPGTAAFLTSSTAGIPLPLTHHLKHIYALHERVLLVTVLTLEEPGSVQNLSHF